MAEEKVSTVEAPPKPGFLKKTRTSGTKVLTGFRDFILRGNVVDLAVAIVVGTAFTAVVKALVGQLARQLMCKHQGCFRCLAWKPVFCDAACLLCRYRT